MERMKVVLLLIASLFILLPVLAVAADFEVDRFVVCEDISGREPVSVRDSFSVSTGSVWAFIEARNIKKESKISLVWIFEGEQVADIALKLGKGDRWRTFGSKNLGDRVGSWEVKLKNSSGKVVDSVAFTVTE